MQSEQAHGLTIKLSDSSQLRPSISKNKLSNAQSQKLMTVSPKSKAFQPKQSFALIKITAKPYYLAIF